MEEVKECHIRYKKVRICECSNCGGTGYTYVNHVIVVCPECCGSGYMKESDNVSEK